jgi:hypothetical protein
VFGCYQEVAARPSFPLWRVLSIGGRYAVAQLPRMLQSKRGAAFKTAETETSISSFSETTTHIFMRW